MFIQHISTDDLGKIILQLVQSGLTFEATSYAEGMWTIELTGGY
jgi:hypothetical protein